MRLATTLRITLAAALAASLVAPWPTGAEPPAGKGKPAKAHGQGRPGKGSGPVAPSRTPGHGPGAGSGAAGSRTLVSASIAYDAARRLALEHHYTGYGALPPGVRKNLARGKPVPPGIAKRAVPGPMLGQLPRYPGYEWRVYGSDLVLVSVATAVVANVLHDVFK